MPSQNSLSNAEQSRESMSLDTQALEDQRELPLSDSLTKEPFKRPLVSAAKTMKEEPSLLRRLYQRNRDPLAMTEEEKRSKTKETPTLPAFLLAI